MIRWLGLATAALLAVGAMTTVADERPAVPPGCEVPDHLRTLTEGLPHMMQAVARGGALKVVVMGSGSSGGGAIEAARAYPSRFEKELSRRLKTTQVSVAVKARPGQTAAEMMMRIKTEVIAEKPALVIWQTGTVDAVRGVNPESFAESLVTGIEALHKAGIDVILVDMQYSPRTSSMVHLEQYRKLMMWVSQRRDVFMFRRYEVMQYWNENDIFDLGAEDRAEQRRVADRVHGCLGQLLADVVLTSWEVARERSP
jgi:hypothetical protein